VRDLIFPIFAGVALIIMIANIGAAMHRIIFDERLLERCEQKQEFILGRTVVKCEIVKDLR
jgi:hypothetical protein